MGKRGRHHHSWGLDGREIRASNEHYPSHCTGPPWILSSALRFITRLTAEWTQRMFSDARPRKRRGGRGAGWNADWAICAHASAMEDGGAVGKLNARREESSGREVTELNQETPCDPLPGGGVRHSVLCFCFVFYFALTLMSPLFF